MSQEITEPTITLASALAGQLPVIIGGLLAIGGALSGTLLAYFLNAKSQRKALKIAKLEELLCAANNTEHWLDEYRNMKFLSGDEKDIGPSPIAKVQYLSKLYIKELNLEVVNLVLASANYYSLITATLVEKLETGSIPETFLEEYGPIMRELKKKTSELVDSAGKLASEL